MPCHETDELIFAQHFIPQQPVWIALWLEHLDDDIV